MTMISVKYVNPPKPGARSGSIKTPEGDYYGLLAEYDSVGALFSACEKVRDAGYTKWDAHSPFPVHNLDKAMGLGKGGGGKKKK